MTEQSLLAAIDRLLLRVPPFIIVVLTALMALGVSGTVYWLEYRSEEARLVAEFKRAAQERMSALRWEARHHQEIVQSLAALYNASHEVSAAEFDRFTLQLQAFDPDIQAFEWIQRVGRTGRADFEREAGRRHPGFRISERGPEGKMVRAAGREEHFPVTLVQPQAENDAAIGFDLASEPVRRAALEQARDSGAATAGGPIHLVQEATDQWGYLLFVPVYAGGEVPASVAERRARLRGFALGVLRIGNTVEHALSSLRPRGIDLWLFDVDSSGESRLVYQRRSSLLPRPVAPRPMPDAGLKLEENMEVAGHTWRLVLAPAPGFYQHGNHYAAWGLLIAGLLTAFFVAVYLYSLQRQFAALKRSEVGLRLRHRAIEASRNGVLITDARVPGNPIIYVNPAFERITGYRAAEAVGQSPAFLYGADREQPELEKIRQALAHHQADSALLRNYRKDGSLFWNELHIAPVHDEAGVLTHFVGILNDVTAYKRYEEQLEYQAHHDELTGLPNRNLMRDRLDQALIHARRYERMLAVVFVDIDQFKVINDSLGHSAGDHVLRQFAGRLKRLARQGDTVARYGGDEFILILVDLASADDLPHIAARLLEEAAHPIDYGERSLTLTISAGISLYPRDGDNGETLLKNADAAMYRAKELGRNTFHFFTEELNARVMERLTLEGDLRRALERNELRLHYQPQVSLASGRITGFEALLRWQHPQQGLVAPGRFIALAEETGLIVPIGAWVLQTACEQFRAWQRAGLAPELMSVNVSARQFRETSFRAAIAGVLERSGIGPECLEIEITESTIMLDPRGARELLTELRALGVKVALDDFGTGYSSFSQLKHFPFSRIKIDQSFVEGVAEKPEDAAIVRTIIAMAQGLGLNVIAEGVETAAQLAFLRRHGCNCMQGYLFSKPLPADQAEALLRSGRRLQLQE